MSRPFGLALTGIKNLGHKNIIKYCGRPFQDAHEMNKTILDHYNELVKEGDKFYFLGDLCMDKRKASRFLDRMEKGEIYFILGNHDKAARKIIEEHYRVTWASKYEEINVNGLLITLCHHAQLSWNKSHYNFKEGRKTKLVSINLFGHSHGSLVPPSPFQMDVGVDAVYKLTGQYRPISLEEILVEMQKNYENKAK